MDPLVDNKVFTGRLVYCICKLYSFKSGLIYVSPQVTIGPVSIGMEVQRNIDGDTPSREERANLSAVVYL